MDESHQRITYEMAFVKKYQRLVAFSFYTCLIYLYYLPFMDLIQMNFQRKIDFLTNSLDTNEIASRTC